MKIERGDLFVNTHGYRQCEICICIGVKGRMVWYLEIGNFNGFYSYSGLTENDLWLGYTRSRVKGVSEDGTNMKLPLSYLDAQGLANYNHIKQKFLDTNIL